MFSRGKPADGAAKPKDAAAQAKPALTVTVAKPESSELTVTLAANGNIAAWQEASVGSESNGLRLAEVRVNVGDVVKKGQVLATFSPETVQADMAQARASLAEARGDGRRRRRQRCARAHAAGHRRAEPAADQSVPDRRDRRPRRASRRPRPCSRRSRCAAATRRCWRPTTASSPRAPPPWAACVSAGTELFRLIRQGRLEWRAEVTSAELSRVAVGTPAIVISASGAQVNGKVRSIAPTVDPQTRAALVYVDIPDVLQNTGIKAGMFARGDFQLGRSSALTVPQASIVPRDGFNHLLLLQPDNRVAQLKVADRPPGRRPRRDHHQAAGRCARRGPGRRLPERRRPGAGGGGHGGQGAAPMNVSAWSIRNPIPAVMLFVLLTFAGMLSFNAMKVQNFPDIDLPTVTVSASLPGAAPSQLETDVARKLENSIATIQGLKHITTKVQDGAATLIVEFRLEKPVQEAVDDVRSAVQKVRADLPADVRDPVINKLDFAAQPVLAFTISSLAHGRGRALLVRRRRRDQEAARHAAASAR